MRLIQRFWKPVLFLVLLVLVIPAAFFLALEFGLKWAGVGYPTSLFLEDPQDPGTVVRNADYTSPYFGRAAARKLFPFRISKTPAEHTFRIVMLGGSAAQGDPMPAFSPARILERALQAAYPQQRFECINLAITAINAHVVKDVARQAAALQPDLAIVYLGNNEFIGPFGPGHSGTAGRLSSANPDLATFIRKTRISQFLQSTRRAETGPEDWHGMQQFLNHGILPADPRADEVYRRFDVNLRSIINSLQQGGTEVILSTVGVNILSQPPFSGDRARQQYNAGRRLYQSGALSAAFDALNSAKELDELRFRADDRINGIISRAAGDDGLRLVNAADSFNSPEHLSGDGIFLEHVHFTFAGNYRLAGMLFQEVSSALLVSSKIDTIQEFPPIEQLQAGLAYTGYDEYLLTVEMIDRFKKPPFSTIPETMPRISELENRRDALTRQFGRKQFQLDTYATYRQAIERFPDDWVLKRNYADVLRLYGEFGQAKELYTGLLAQFPDVDYLAEAIAKCDAAME